MAKLYKEISEGSVVGQVLHDVVFLILDEIRNVERQVKLILNQVSEAFQALFLYYLFAELNKQEKGVTQAGVYSIPCKEKYIPRILLMIAKRYLVFR